MTADSQELWKVVLNSSVLRWRRNVVSDGTLLQLNSTQLKFIRNKVARFFYDLHWWRCKFC